MSHNGSPGEHPTHLQHHFDTERQQFSASKLGMWLFLAQEVLFFGGLFCGYAVYRAMYPDVYHYAQQALNKNLGALNTVVLLVSSLTMAMAVRCAQRSNRSGLLINLSLTFLCATGFMVVKFIEYKEKIQHGYLFGYKFNYSELDHRLAEERDTAHAASRDEAPPEETSSQVVELSTIKPAAIGPAGIVEVEPPVVRVDSGHAGEEHGKGLLHGPRPPNVHLFFGLYFALTGLHGIHVLGGMVMLVWLMVGSLKGKYHSGYFTPVDLGGLYWHLVDLIWIFLFPLLYLLG